MPESERSPGAISRRWVLRAGGIAGAAGVAAAVIPGASGKTLLDLVAADGAAGQSGSGGLALTRFFPHVGTEFYVRTGRSTPVAVTLMEATANPPHPDDRPGLKGESFSLLFGNDKSRAFDDGTYSISHRSLGTFTLFLVPVNKPDDGQRYEAVIDRRS